MENNITLSDIELVRREFRRIRPVILKRDNYTCQKCYYRNLKGMHVHHIKWVTDGGNSDPKNLITLCHYCHYHCPDDVESFKKYIARHLPESSSLLLSVVKYTIFKEREAGVNFNDDYLINKFDNRVIEVYKEFTDRYKEIVKDIINNEEGLND